MVSEEATRKMVQELKKAGFTPVRKVGSHSWWECPTSKHGISVPDGHKTISPGLVRKIRQTIADCNC